MFCCICGKQIPEGSRVCCYCGKPVIEELKPAPEGSAVYPSGEVTKMGADMPNTKPNRKGTKWLWLGIAVVAILAVILLILHFVNKKQAADDGTVTLWVLTEVTRENNGEIFVLETYEYDDNGNLVYESLYGNRAYKYTYDEDGNCTSSTYEITTDIDGSEEVVSQTENYTYRYEDGRVTGKYLNDNLHTVYQYDSDGNLIEMGSGNEYSGYWRRFDEEGYLTEVEIRDRDLVDGQDVYELYRAEYEYEDGVLTQVQICRAESVDPEDLGNGDLQETICFVYEDGHMSEMIALDANGEEKHSISFETDSHGNIISNYGYVFKYEKREVTREQAMRLIRENYPYDNFGVGFKNQYRIEE